MSHTSENPSAALLLASLLAAVAGFVDAHIYLHLTQVFVANMSGNLIGLGMFAGGGDWKDAASAAVAIVAFVAGVGATTVVQQRERRRTGGVRTGRLLTAEAALLVGLALALWRMQPSRVDAWRPVYLIPIVVASAAMGVQAAALGHVGAVTVTTTYGTGSLVRIGQRLAPVRGAEPARRALTVVVLGVVLSSYVAGAAISAAAGSPGLLMLAPAAVLVGAARLARRVDRADRSPLPRARVES